MDLTIENRDKLPSESGIYFVIRDSKVIYIGKAKNVWQRWQHHHRLPDTLPDDVLKFIPVSEDLLDITETGCNSWPIGKACGHIASCNARKKVYCRRVLNLSYEVNRMYIQNDKLVGQAKTMVESLQNNPGITVDEICTNSDSCQCPFAQSFDPCAKSKLQTMLTWLVSRDFLRTTYTHGIVKFYAV
jgi:hypothetical protein